MKGGCTYTGTASARISPPITLRWEFRGIRILSPGCRAVISMAWMAPVVPFTAMKQASLPYSFAASSCADFMQPSGA